MNDEEYKFMEQQEQQNRGLQNQLNYSQIGLQQQSMLLEEKEKGMISEQLDLELEISNIENLLKGRSLRQDKEGNVKWEDSEDKNMVILSNYGVQLVVNNIRWYLNKNTLLSNYDGDTINTKMEDFSISLADVIFMEYENVFEYPSAEKCKEVLIERIERKTDLRKFALELLGEKVDANYEFEIKKGFIIELENKIESELEKIKQQLIKNKLKRFDILLRQVQDAVHSTYLRAWKGQERITLRQHIHVAENRSPMMMPQKRSKINPLNWGGGK